jgi:NhaP-type Na+/H+ or K+/H+ antiporter
MRSGLELDFEGKGLTVVLLTIVPQIFEAGTVACFTRLFFGMPWALCFANGFCIGAVSPAVLVPSVMTLIELRRGTAKGIPQIMLAASSFDDILAITLFSVFSSVSMDSILAAYPDPKKLAR